MTNIKYNNIEWLGDIPTEWNVDQVGNYYELRNEKVNDYDFAPLSVTMKGVVPQLATAAKSNDHTNRKLVKKGDFVINSRSDRRGSCGISPLDGSVSLINTVMEPRGEMNPQYYNWLFHTEQFADEFYKWGHGIVNDLWTTRWQEMKKILIVAPELDEQQAIADYLDEKCSKIDEIIAEAKASIDEYKELRLSVLTSVTTKGLSNDVKYKDSGSRWVDEIPSDWSKMKIHYIIDMPVIDGPHVSPKLVSEGVNYISANAIVDGKIDFNKRRGYITREYSNECRKRYSPQKNDILVVKLGASTGKMAMVGDFTDFDIWVPIAVVRCKKEVNAKYVYYSMSSKYFKDEIKDGWTFGTQETLGVKTLESLYIFLPSRVEQDEIVRYLDEQLPKYDSLIAEKESLINDLEAYKKSLIYEVVTGKRRVV